MKIQKRDTDPTKNVYCSKPPCYNQPMRKGLTALGMTWTCEHYTFYRPLSRVERKLLEETAV